MELKIIAISVLHSFKENLAVLYLTSDFLKASSPIPMKSDSYFIDSIKDKLLTQEGA